MVGDREERDIVVENDAVRAVFTNRGAVLKSWTLKRYKDGKGASLDLVPQIVRGGPRPFTLLVEDGKLSATLQERDLPRQQPGADGGVHAGDAVVRVS